MSFLFVWHEAYRSWLHELNLERYQKEVIYHVSLILTSLILSFLLYKLVKYILSAIARKLLERKSENGMLKALLDNNVFSRISYYVPLFFIRYIITVFPNTTKFESFISVLYHLASLVLLCLIVSSLLNAFVDYYQYKEKHRSKPIKGFVQFFQILVFFFTFVIGLSILLNIPLTAMLGGLGAASAIVILVFKDSVAGLIAGFQLSFNDMLKIGDWISMEKYGIDGEVIDINLASVKVQNWDKTIATVPAYNLVASDSVRNWQGMIEFGGRRIARSIYIDMNSVQFCTEEMLARYQKIKDVSQYIKDKIAAIEHFNRENQVEQSSINGRRQTNLGIFRAYLNHYLQKKDGINRGASLMVRQMEPGPNGVPLQIYCFTDTTVWREYENIQSDIFDHILAIIPYFDLQVFQNPNGKDIVNHVFGRSDRGDASKSNDFDNSNTSNDSSD